MASFVSTMHEWRRMCSAIQSENQKSPSGSWCSNCPIEQFCVIDTEIKDSTDNVFRIIDERVQAWADKNKEPVYPTWIDWLRDVGVIPTQEEASHSMRDGVRAASFYVTAKAFSQIPADIAQKLKLEPKEG